MPDLFVEWLDDHTIVVYDADRDEIWRGTAAYTVDLLRSLSERGLIGIVYEEDADDDDQS